jgi:hypothetical protein
MITENSFNAFYFVECAKNILIIFGITFIVISLINVIGRYAKDKLDNKKDIHFKDKDVEVVSEAFKKIGEVKNGTKNEVILNAQNVENNKEIHAINQKFDKIETEMEELKEITSKLASILEELEKRG